MTLLTDDFVFIHVPKAGGTFIHTVLLGGGPTTFSEATRPESVPSRWRPVFAGHHLSTLAIPLSHSDLPVLAVKRNPWAWYVSWYYFSARHLDTPQGRKIVENDEWGYFSRVGYFDFNDTMRRMFELPGNGLPAIERWRNNREGLWTDRYRCYLTLDKQLSARGVGRRVLDISYIRCETLRESLLQFLEKFAHVPSTLRDRILSLPKANVSVDGDFRRHYDDDVIELIAKADLALIKKFDYSFSEVGSDADSNCDILV